MQGRNSPRRAEPASLDPAERATYHEGRAPGGDSCDRSGIGSWSHPYCRIAFRHQPYEPSHLPAPMLARSPTSAPMARDARPLVTRRCPLDTPRRRHCRASSSHAPARRRQVTARPAFKCACPGKATKLGGFRRTRSVLPPPERGITPADSRMSRGRSLRATSTRSQSTESENARRWADATGTPGAPPPRSSAHCPGQIRTYLDLRGHGAVHRAAVRDL